MNTFMWIIFGGFVGWIASIIMGTNAKQGIILNIVVGIIGAFLGGWLMTYFGKTGITGFDLYSFFVALAGAILLIAFVKLFQ